MRPVTPNRVNQVSISEALLVQGAIALVLAFDVLMCQRITFTYLLAPVILTQWSAFRMHGVGMTRWRNPFVIGIVSTIASFVLHAVIQNPHAPDVTFVAPAGTVRTALDWVIATSMTTLMLALVGFLLACQCVALSAAFEEQWHSGQNSESDTL